MTDLEVLQGRPWAVLAGDCRETLAALPADSIDACVTDTPYGLSTILDPPNLDREALWRRLTEGTAESPIKMLMRAWLDNGDNPVVKGRGFMGKEWDALVPSPNTWRAIWRVLKPGAYCFAFGGTRTYDLISMSLRFADFEIDDNISNDTIGPVLRWYYGSGMPKRVRLDLKIDQHFGKASERPVTGSKLDRPGYHLHPGDGGGVLGKGIRSHTTDERLRASQEFGAATPEAARFVGWDRALRPGWEPIIVATKPRRGTIAENAMAHGTGGLHVDACRLPRGDGGPLRWDETRGMGYAADGSRKQGIDNGPCGFTQDARGGYPANVAMDEAVAEELDRMSGVTRSSVSGYDWTPSVTDNAVTTTRNIKSGIHHGDTGGASRFFYVAKASSSERDAGLEDLPPLTAGERCDREDGTAGVNGYAGTRGEGGRNPHPTVKPIALMRWLVRLASPPGAGSVDLAERPVILDPFAGSGSTGVAAMLEGVRFIGCELEEKSADVMRRRLQHAYALPPDDEAAPTRNAETVGQKSLF